MPVYSWVDKTSNIFVRAKIGNGHTGGIAARLDGNPVGKANDELVIDLGPGAGCIRKTLVVTADVLKGEANPPPPVVLTVSVHQGPAGDAPPPKNPQTFPVNEDPPPFDANGMCTVPLAVTFL